MTRVIQRLRSWLFGDLSFGDGADSKGKRDFGFRWTFAGQSLQGGGAKGHGPPGIHPVPTPPGDLPREGGAN